jgi:serine protease Do
MNMVSASAMRLCSTCLFWFAVALPVAAQAEQDWIDDELLELRITRACAELRAKDLLVPCEQLVLAAASAKTFPVTPAVPRTNPLAPEALCALVRQSARIVGHYYLCTECDDWHFSGASGCCVGSDGLVATCHHVLGKDETMREAFLVVADLEGHVWPAQRVVAADEGADVSVIKVDATGWVPLPIARSVQQGQRIYCLSNPDHQFGFFSEGLLARRYRERDPVPDGSEPQPADRIAPREWLHVTCDFAKGSSGAPIVDVRGSLVGIAQSTTTVIYDEEAKVIDTQMTFKTAVPASTLVGLLPAPASDSKASDSKTSDSKASDSKAGKAPAAKDEAEHK